MSGESCCSLPSRHAKPVRESRAARYASRRRSSSVIGCFPLSRAFTYKLRTWVDLLAVRDADSPYAGAIRPRLAACLRDLLRIDLARVLGLIGHDDAPLPGPLRALAACSPCWSLACCGLPARCAAAEATCACWFARLPGFRFKRAVLCSPFAILASCSTARRAGAYFEILARPVLHGELSHLARTRVRAPQNLVSV